MKDGPSFLVDDILDERHQKLSTRDLREHLAKALSYASRQKGAIVLTKNGEDRAAIVSIEDLWILDALQDLRVKEALRGELKREVLWSVLKERLSDFEDLSKTRKRVTGEDRRHEQRGSKTGT
jgi:prevent-host-death family protein